MQTFCLKRATAFAVILVALGAQTVSAKQTASTPVAVITLPDSAPTIAAAPMPTASVAPSVKSGNASSPVVHLNQISPPPEGKGQVVFYRVSRMVGMVVNYTVHDGDKGIGKLTNGTYFVYVTDPGTKDYSIGVHDIWSGSVDALRLEVEDGETYYVVQSINAGSEPGPNLTPSTEEAFQAKKLKVSTAVPTDLH